MTPTQRTLKYLRGMGRIADVVERWIPRTKIRKDLFGFADIVAVSDWIWAVQTTSGSNHAARRHKILSNSNARAWVAAGGRIALISWSKKICPIRKRQVWTERVETLGANDFLNYLPPQKKGAQV